MNVGYARVSSKDQNLDRQIAALHDAGVERIFAQGWGRHRRNAQQEKTKMAFIIALASCDGGLDLIVPLVVSGMIINYVMLVLY